MKIIVLTDKKSKGLRYMSDAVMLAALEKQVSCEPMDISDQVIDAAKVSSPDYIDRIADLMAEEKADVVLCTGINAMKLMTRIRHREGCTVLTYGVFSDYTCSPSLQAIDMDFYFVPHEDIKRRLLEQGMSEERVFVTGIPVKKNFREHIGKAAARNYLVIPKSRRIYLLIADGLTPDTILRLCEELAVAETEDYVLYIPTARSSPIRDKLVQYSGKDAHVRIITYTKQLHLYIESADAMLLKPDTLTSTEAAVAGVPIVHLCLNEKADTFDFFASHEMAVIGKSIRDTIRKAQRFVEEKAMAARVIQMQYRNIYADAAEKIIDIILGKRKTTT